MSVEIKWIKLSTSMFDDEKIKLIRTMPEGDSITLIWIQLLCLAGKINDGGAVYLGQNLAYSDEMLATIFNYPLNTMRIALSTLEDFGLIEFGKEDTFRIANWEKHQSTDKMARIKQQNKDRQQKHYYRSKLRELDVDVDSKDFPEDLEKIKELYQYWSKKPNVSLTLPNATEVRSKRLDVRGKKKEVRGKKEEQHHQEKKGKFDVDEGFKKVSNFFQNNLGQLSSFVAEDLLLWIDDLNADLVIEALKRTVENQKQYSYAKGIMKNWVNKNVKSIEDVKALDVSFNNQTRTYEEEEESPSEWPQF